MFIHVSLIVSIPGTGELKSKPTQHSAKELLSLGIQPDVIMCRSDEPVPGDILDKIALFCNIPRENAIPNLTAPLLYEVPLMLEREGLGDAWCTGWAHLPRPRPHRVGHHGPPGQASHRTVEIAWWASMWPP